MAADTPATVDDVVDGLSAGAVPRQGRADAVAPEHVATAGAGAPTVAVAVDDGTDELAVLVFGGDKVALGSFERVSVFIQARARLGCLVRKLIFDALHLRRQARAGHCRGEGAGSALGASRTNCLCGLARRRSEAREFAGNK